MHQARPAMHNTVNLQRPSGHHGVKRKFGSGSGDLRSRSRSLRHAVSERSSLVPDTLEQMQTDPEWQAVQQRTQRLGQAALSREEERARRRALSQLELPAFQQALQGAGLPPLVRGAATILQLNVGLYCNQACTHCHVESSPARTEAMSREVADRCLQVLEVSPGVTTLDLTGGAPELNPQFRHLVSRAAALGVPTIIDRCNLTVLLEPGQADLPQFLADHRVTVVASLPCYSSSNVDKQRGRGVFQRSIEGLQLLNAVGYGVPGSGLELVLVYNPGGAFLAPSQATLEAAYRQELQEAYGITFSRLLALNNMPIKRFADWLLRQGQLEEYMGLLVGAFNPATVGGLMCKDTVSVNWEGRLFDCDFNQQLDLPMSQGSTPSSLEQDSSSNSSSDEQPGSSSNDTNQQDSSSSSSRRSGLTVWDIDDLSDLTGRPVRVASHCYGCTAGAGSSCQGATAED